MKLMVKESKIGERRLSDCEYAMVTLLDNIDENTSLYEMTKAELTKNGFIEVAARPWVDSGIKCGRFKVVVEHEATPEEYIAWYYLKVKETCNKMSSVGCMHTCPLHGECLINKFVKNCEKELKNKEVSVVP